MTYEKTTPQECYDALVMCGYPDDARLLVLIRTWSDDERRYATNWAVASKLLEDGGDPRAIPRYIMPPFLPSVADCAVLLSSMKEIG